jgi:hypothetical protein
MVSQAQIAELAVIGSDFLAKIDDAGFVLIMQVSFDESLGQLDRLSQREVLSGSFV